MLIDKYICHLRDVRRYSLRTVDIYSRALNDFATMLSEDTDDVSDEVIISSLVPSMIRRYEVYMLDAVPPKSPRTVGLYMSALSGFCRYLMKEGKIASNPVKLVPKPKVEKRIPHFFRKTALDEYFARTADLVKDEELSLFIESPQSASGKI